MTINNMKKRDESIAFLESHCEFNEPTDCYVLLAVSRKKDTPDIHNSTEIIFREVIKHKDEIKKKYLKMAAQITNYRDENDRSFPFYLYISLNPCNARKAAVDLLREITKWLDIESTDKNIIKNYKGTYGQFYSCLMYPHNRGSKKYFMIDFDTKDISLMIPHLKNSSILTFFGQEVLTSRETRNGYHLKMKPFDPRLVPPSKDYTIKKDCLMFVEYFENQVDMVIEVPEARCVKCHMLIPSGQPFCYECMQCHECSPDCFSDDEAKENMNYELIEEKYFD